MARRKPDPEAVYRFDLVGFGNGRVVEGLTLEQAREEYEKARTEEYKLRDDPNGINYGRTARWTLWELWRCDGPQPVLVASGRFDGK